MTSPRSGRAFLLACSLAFGTVCITSASVQISGPGNNWREFREQSTIPSGAVVPGAHVDISGSALIGNKGSPHRQSWLLPLRPICHREATSIVVKASGFRRPSRCPQSRSKVGRFSNRRRISQSRFCLPQPWRFLPSPPRLERDHHSWPDQHRCSRNCGTSARKRHSSRSFLSRARLPATNPLQGGGPPDQRRRQC